MKLLKMLKRWLTMLLKDDVNVNIEYDDEMLESVNYFQQINLGLDSNIKPQLICKIYAPLYSTKQYGKELYNVCLNNITDFLGDKYAIIPIYLINSNRGTDIKLELVDSLPKVEPLPKVDLDNESTKVWLACQDVNRFLPRFLQEKYWLNDEADYTNSNFCKKDEYYISFNDNDINKIIIFKYVDDINTITNIIYYDGEDWNICNRFDSDDCIEDYKQSFPSSHNKFIYDSVLKYINRG